MSIKNHFKITKEDEKRCAFCGWMKYHHRNGLCYHYSDEDTDYFYKDKKFTPILTKKEK